MKSKKEPVDHYAVLGIDKNATPTEIKRTYRDRASKAHPDKQGGNQVMMAAINTAYDVLSDPERRSRYDTFGDDSAKTVDAHVRDLILAAFADAMNSNADMLLEHAVKFITEQMKTISGNYQNAGQAKEQLIARKALITKSKGLNLFHGLVDQQVANIKAAQKEMEHHLEIHRSALEELSGYESEEKRPQPPTMTIVLGNSSSSTW